MSGGKKITEALSCCTGKIFYDEPMSRYASLKVGGKADALVIVESETQLLQVVQELGAAGVSYHPLGNLTNVIVRDGGYRGVILLMKGLNKAEYRQNPEGKHFITAEAGASLAAVVGISEEYALTGLEFCAGIPGSIGGAVWMNAGAFGREMKDVVAEIELFSADGRKTRMKREEITFYYRKTDLPEKTIILRTILQLERGEREKIRQKIKEIIELRRMKHPLAYPSAGSVFKNLPDRPAGRIIEEMGLKGISIGGAEISSQHANFIVNKGGATASDILALIDLIRDKAKNEKGIVLETEVIVIGDN